MHAQTFHLPQCPPDLNIPIYSLSSFIMEIFIASASLVLAVITFCLYNSVSLPNRTKSVSTRTISNSMWVVYFLSVCCRSILGAIRWGKSDTDMYFVFWTSTLSHVFHGFSCLFLMLALNYQRRYRSGYAVFWQNWTLFKDQFGKAASTEQKHTVQVVHDEDINVAGSTTSVVTTSDEDQDPLHHRRSRRALDANVLDANEDYDAMMMAQQETGSLKDNDYGVTTWWRFQARMICYRCIYFLCAIETMVIMLLFGFLVTVYLRAADFGGYDKVFAWIQLAAVILQRLPIILLTLVIIFTPRGVSKDLMTSTSEAEDDVNDDANHSHQDAASDIIQMGQPEKHFFTPFQRTGPGLLAKLWLIIAVLLNTPNDIPMSFWHMLFDGRIRPECPFFIASMYDVIFLMYWASLLFWFVFMRSEYKRNQEETMFMAIKRSQNDFDYRPFY